jgi:hypothetical protein
MDFFKDPRAKLRNFFIFSEYISGFDNQMKVSLDFLENGLLRLHKNTNRRPVVSA